jgi:hypothetical protein
MSAYDPKRTFVVMKGLSKRVRCDVRAAVDAEVGGCLEATR